MGEGYCIECGATGVEVRPVPSGGLVCLGCLSTYSKNWIKKHYPDQADNAQGAAAMDIAVSKTGMSHDDMPCSTLVVQSYPDKELPEGVANQYKSKKFVDVERENIGKGDLIFFKSDDGQGRINHVGMVVGVNKDGSIHFIHSSLSRGVIISNTKNIGGYGKSTWEQLIKGFRKIK